MVDLTTTDWIVCSLNVIASESNEGAIEAEKSKKTKSVKHCETPCVHYTYQQKVAQGINILLKSRNSSGPLS